MEIKVKEKNISTKLKVFQNSVRYCSMYTKIFSKSC